MAIAALVYSTGLVRDLPLIPEPDEADWVPRAVEMANNWTLNPGWLGHPGSTVLYPLMFLYGVLGITKPTMVAYIVGRLLTLLYTLGCLPLVYAIGSRLWSRRVGLAATFLAVSHVLFAAQATVVRSDSAGTFFALLSLLGIILYLEKPTRNHLFLASISIGLAIATRYFLVALVPLLIVVTYPRWKQTSIGLLATLLAFAITTPFAWLRPDILLQSLTHESRTTHLGADGLSAAENLWWHLSSAIPHSTTVLQLVLALMAMALVLRYRSTRAVVLVGFFWLYLVALSLHPLHSYRWTIQLLPTVGLLAAYLIDLLCHGERSRIHDGQKWKYGSIIVAIGLVPLLQSGQRALQYTNPSTKVAAHEWVQAQSNIKLLSEWHGVPRGDNVELISSLTEMDSIAAIEAQGYTHVATSNFRAGFYRDDPERYPQENQFYDQIEALPRGQLFAPTLWQRGPLITVYSLPN